MSNPVTPSHLDEIARALEQSGRGWRLSTPDRDAYLHQVAQQIDEFVQAYQGRFGDGDPPDPFRLLQDNPEKAAAFFQTLAGRPISVPMRVMVWEIMFGAEITALDFHYRSTGVAELRVTLDESHRSMPEQIFTSEDPRDFRIFRHIGLLTVNNRAVLDGYYALRS